LWNCLWKLSLRANLATYCFHHCRMRFMQLVFYSTPRCARAFQVSRAECKLITCSIHSMCLAVADLSRCWRITFYNALILFKAFHSEPVSKYKAPWGVCCGTWSSKNVVPRPGKRAQCSGLPGQSLYHSVIGSRHNVCSDTAFRLRSQPLWTNVLEEAQSRVVIMAVCMCRSKPSAWNQDFRNTERPKASAVGPEQRNVKLFIQTRTSLSVNVRPLLQILEL